MGQLIGLAVLFCVVAAVCSKLFGTKASAEPTESESHRQRYLRDAYRQGFQDGVEHAQKKSVIEHHRLDN